MRHLLPFLLALLTRLTLACCILVWDISVSPACRSCNELIFLAWSSRPRSSCHSVSPVPTASLKSTPFPACRCHARMRPRSKLCTLTFAARCLFPHWGVRTGPLVLCVVGPTSFSCNTCAPRISLLVPFGVSWLLSTTLAFASGRFASTTTLSSWVRPSRRFARRTSSLLNDPRLTRTGSLAAWSDSGAHSVSHLGLCSISRPSRILTGLSP